jgi:hypothetical protein
MAYQLQPGLSRVQNKGAIPPVKANDEIFVYPQPSGLNCGGCRPNTMLYGTAPYMAGKGSQPNTSTPVINFAPKPHPVSISISSKPMSANSSP